MIRKIIITDNEHNLNEITLSSFKVFFVFKQGCDISYIRAFKQMFLINKQAANSIGKYTYSVSEHSNKILITGNVSNTIDVLITFDLFNKTITEELERQKLFFNNKGNNCFFTGADSVDDSENSDIDTIAEDNDEPQNAHSYNS